MAKVLCSSAFFENPLYSRSREIIAYAKAIGDSIEALVQPDITETIPDNKLLLIREAMQVMLDKLHSQPLSEEITAMITLRTRILAIRTYQRERMDKATFAQTFIQNKLKNTDTPSLPQETKVINDLRIKLSTLSTEQLQLFVDLLPPLTKNINKIDWQLHDLVDHYNNMQIETRNRLNSSPNNASNNYSILSTGPSM
jgi:hypothetical protein